jgi:hypothetical protein
MPDYSPYITCSRCWGTVKWSHAVKTHLGEGWDGYCCPTPCKPTSKTKAAMAKIANANASRVSREMDAQA